MNRVAAIQMASGPNITANLEEAAKLIKTAVQQDAQLVVLPENFSLMGLSEVDKVNAAETEGKGPMQDFLAEQAAKRQIWLVGGTIPLQSPVTGKVYSACILYNDKGENVARYDKIHLFDVVLESNKESYNESETIEPGKEVVVVDTPFGKLGMAVCYDLRFPELFRAMTHMGMEICVLPSAFTSLTGKAHWESLLRARAIENLCFMVAPDQGGYHINGRETHGDSMIVDPWGVILNRLPHGTGAVVSDLDMHMLKKTRENFPSLSHKRLSSIASQA